MNVRKRIGFALVCLMLLYTFLCDTICVYGAEDEFTDEILIDREDEIIMSSDEDLMRSDDVAYTDEHLVEDRIISHDDECLLLWPQERP